MTMRLDTTMKKLFKEVLPLYEQHLTAIYSVSTPSECMRTWLRSVKATGNQHGVRTSETHHFFYRTAFTSNSFIKFRFPLKISSRARSSYLDTSLLYFLFCYAGETPWQ
jgi:hypothetical protein